MHIVYCYEILNSAMEVKSMCHEFAFCPKGSVVYTVHLHIL